MVAAMEIGPSEDLTEDLVEDYLDHLCAPLVGIVPYQDRRLLRSEAAFVIDRLVRAGILDGLDPEVATRKAIQRYGDSQELSERFLSEWTRHRERGFLARRLGLPKLYGALFFGQATLWGLVMPARLDAVYVGYLLVAPMVAGALAGRLAPTAVGRDMAPVVLVAALCSSVAALLGLPASEGALLPLFQLLWWLPAGGFAAQAVGAMFRRHLVRFTPRKP